MKTADPTQRYHRLTVNPVRVVLHFSAALVLAATAAGAASTPPQKGTRDEDTEKTAAGKPVLAWKGTEKDIIGKYRSALKAYSSKLCSKGEDVAYEKLLKEYRGKGHYVPEHPPGKVDLEAIRAHLPEIRAKHEWIQKQVASLEKKRRLPHYGKLTAPLRTALKRAVELKKAHRTAGSDAKKKKIRAEAAANLERIKKEFTAFTSKIPFLLSYGFPVDHFENRRRFESVKHDPRKKPLSNRIFFKRSLHEDGTFNVHRRRSDEYLRTAIDTLALSLPKEKDFISENVRSDLDWVIDRIHPFISEGKRGQLQRLRAWRKRSAEALEFYTGLAANQNGAADKLMLSKTAATAKLKEFVLKKQAEAYAYLHGQPELIRALFTLESILYNEIGSLREFDRLDRRDIIQVVLNRTEHPKYSRLGPKDSIYKHLIARKGLTAPKIRASKWLNTYFKEGEFSFTYHFIPSVVSTFCPDQSRRAWNIRETNLSIALEMLQEPNRSFGGLRYFSRGSMKGRIDMSGIWKAYARIPERPGIQARDQNALRRHVQNDDYRFLYRFQDAQGEWFDVVEISGRKYSLSSPGLDQPDAEAATFFHYRDPHRFTYFEATAAAGGI